MGTKFTEHFIGTESIDFYKSDANGWYRFRLKVNDFYAGYFREQSHEVSQNLHFYCFAGTESEYNAAVQKITDDDSIDGDDAIRELLKIQRRDYFIFPDRMTFAEFTIDCEWEFTEDCREVISKIPDDCMQYKQSESDYAGFAN